jgi:PDZ domain-containing secreted protein
MKVIGAEQAGAEAFLLPREDIAAARGAAEEIELVPVGTVEEALGYLEGAPTG